MKRLQPWGTGLVALTVGALAWPPVAQATTDYTWSGVNGGIASGWSVSGNWQGDSSPSGSIGTLSFPDLSGCDAGMGGPCYSSTDDVGDVSAAQLRIDDDRDFFINASNANPSATLTLEGSGSNPVVGLTAAPDEPISYDANFGQPEIHLPIELGADQTWNIAGDGNLDEDGLYVDTIGGAHALTVDLTDGGQLASNAISTDTLDASGSGDLLIVSGLPDSGATLPAGGTTIQNGVDLWDYAPGTTSGPLTASDSELDLGQPGRPEGGTLAVTGNVTLDSTSALYLHLYNNGSVPGTDFTQLTSTGDVALGGATLYLTQELADQFGDCTTLSPGESFPVISASGSLSGDATYLDAGGDLATLAPGESGSTIVDPPSGCASGAPSSAAIAVLNYGAHAITATIASPPAEASLAPAISGSTVVGNTLYIGNPGTWSGAPTPTYSYQWMLCSTGGCSPISGATGQTYTTTSSEAGDSIDLKVTATNPSGSASAYSNELGPLTAQPSGTPTTAPSGPTSTTGAQSSGPSDAEVTAAIRSIMHPSGARALRTFSRSGAFRSSFDAPGSGTLSILWTTSVRTGAGKHRKKQTLKLVDQSLHCSGAGDRALVIHLTAAGRALLQKSPRGLRVVASYRFTPSGTPAAPVTVTQRFTP